MDEKKEQLCRNVLNYCLCFDMARASINRIDSTKKVDKLKVSTAIYEQVSSHIKKQADIVSK